MTTTETGIVELLPCPFCGEHLIEEAANAIQYGCWNHPRGDCLMRDMLIVDTEGAEQKVAAWNTRAIAAMPDTQLLQTMASALEDARRFVALAQFDADPEVQEAAKDFLPNLAAALAQYREPRS